MYAGLSFFAKLVASTASFMKFEANLLILVVAPFDITLSWDYDTCIGGDWPALVPKAEGGGRV